MAMLTPTAIQGFKEYTRVTINYARYRVGNTYYRIPDANLTKDYLADGRLAVKLLIDTALPGNIRITEIQLFDTNGNLWLVKPENIIREDVTAGILYRFTFNFTEN